MHAHPVHALPWGSHARSSPNPSALPPSLLARSPARPPVLSFLTVDLILLVLCHILSSLSAPSSASLFFFSPFPPLFLLASQLSHNPHPPVYASDAFQGLVARRLYLQHRVRPILGSRCCCRCRPQSTPRCLDTSDTTGPTIGTPATDPKATSTLPTQAVYHVGWKTPRPRPRRIVPHASSAHKAVPSATNLDPAPGRQHPANCFACSRASPSLSA